MRILVLTNMYPPHHYGGYERSCRDVVERWRAAGHRALVLTGDVQVPGVPWPVAGETDVQRRLRLYWDDHRILDPPLWDRFRLERANGAALEAVLEEFDPEVVSVWAMGALSFGLLTRLAARRVPVVPVICDEWPVYGPTVDAWLRPLAGRPRLARLVGRATRLPASLPPLDAVAPACFVSEHLRAAVRDRSPWSFPGSTVTYSGIEAGEFPFDDVHLDRPWGWRLLYVGRIDPRKGIETVVRALALCPAEATLSIVGGGDERYLSRLRALADELGVGARVSYGVVERSELAGRFDVADVVVFPSEWEEPFGLVPLEAMARGVPVVATTVGGAGEFLADGGNCLTFAAGDAEALVEALQRLARDAALVEHIVAGGRSTAAQLTVDELAAVLEEWHLAAAGRLGHPPRHRPPPVLPAATDPS